MSTQMAQDPQNIGTTTMRIGGMDYIVKLAEWKWDILFSTVCFTEGDAAKKEMFVTLPGIAIQGGVRGLTDVDTNIPDSSKLPIDHEFYVFSPRLRILRVVGSGTVIPPDNDPGSINSDTPNRRILFELNRKIKFNVVIQNKTRSEGRLEDYPSGGGMWGVTNDVGESLFNMGMPSDKDAKALVVPFHLRANVAYKWAAIPQQPMAFNQAQQVNDQLNTSVELQGVFAGLYKVPVT